MLKLPPLQPHLTGTNSEDVHQISYQISSTEMLRRPLPKTTLGTPGIPGLKTRSWKEQSGTITDNLKETKSRSPSTIAQVRLQEALHQCSLAPGCSAAGDGKPHRIRTAVCCKLLEELSALAGPYANMLQILCKEMVNSTYSEIFAHDGSKDRMDQLPYYSIVAKLEKQNSLLMAERQNFQTQLDIQLSNMSGLSNQIQTLSGALQNAETHSSEQSALLLAAKSRERQAATDAEVARTAIQEARAANEKLSSEATSTQEAMQGTINSLQQSYDEAAAAQATAECSLRIRDEEIAQLHTLLQGMIKRTEVEELEAELRELRIQVPELQETVQQQLQKLAALGERTPRPEWSTHRRLLPESEQHVVPISRQAGKPTAAVASKLVSRLSHYASQLDEAARDRDHLQMMLVPDPVQLRFTLDSDSIAQGHQIVVQALGCGGDVPRLLRATGQVCVRILDARELTETIWALLKQWPRQSSTVQGMLLDTWLALDPLAKTIAPKGYCLALSLQAHKDRDPLAAVLHAALHGQLSAHAVMRMACVLQSMEALFEQMSSMDMPDAAAQGCFSWEDVAMLLQRLLPGMSADVRAILEEQFGSCMAGQSVHVRDLLVPREDRTTPCWGRTGQQHAVAKNGVDSGQPGTSSSAQGPVAAVDGDTPQSLKDGIADASEQQVAEQEAADCVAAVAESGTSDSGDQHGGGMKGAEHLSTSRTASSEPGKAEERQLGTAGDCEPWMLVVRLLSHHAGALLQLQRTLAAELRGLEDRSEAAMAGHGEVLAHLEAHMPHAQASACAALWLETVTRGGSRSVRTANTEVLASGPLQCMGDLDVPAAEAWLQGLLERGGGHSSLAALPQVA